MHCLAPNERSRVGDVHGGETRSERERDRSTLREENENYRQREGSDSREWTNEGEPVASTKLLYEDRSVRLHNAASAKMKGPHETTASSAMAAKVVPPSL